LGTSSYLGLLNLASDFAIRQAYVEFARAELGTGLDFKVGVFDTVIGYESVDSTANPITPALMGRPSNRKHTRVCWQHIGSAMRLARRLAWANTIGQASIPVRSPARTLSVLQGFLNWVASGIPSGGDRAESYKTYMGSVALTAPNSWAGFLAQHSTRCRERVQWPRGGDRIHANQLVPSAPLWLPRLPLEVEQPLIT